MPLLTYTSSGFPFTPFTKILSADVNQCFNDVKTLLNITKLDDSNVQVNGLTRNGATSRLKDGTASYVLVNDASGHMGEEQYLLPARGGTGINSTPSGVPDAGKVVAVNATGTAFTLQTVPTPPTLTPVIYHLYV